MNEDNNYMNNDEYSTQYSTEYSNYSMEPKKKKNHVFAKTVGCALAFGLIAGIVVFAVNYLGNKAFPVNDTGYTTVKGGDASTIKTATLLNQQLNTQTIVTDVSSIVESCMPSVVAIEGTVTKETTGFYQQKYESPVAGSGIIIGKNDTELLIVTNAHVVEDVNNLKVTFIDGAQISAVLKGSKSNKDLAVVAVKLSDISQDTMDSIVIAEIGSAENIKVGEAAIAIGNALGYGQSVTVGVISALNREVTIDGVTYNLIQTDAAINPGNSGGALINAYGQVIGINSAKLSDESVEGMGYSIPISDVMDIIEELMSKETREEVEESNRGFLGISGKDIDSATSAAWGYPEGIYVGKVQEGSAAEEAGIEYRDIIVGFDGSSVTTMTALKKKLSYYSAGETVEIELYRYVDNDYKLMTVEVTLKSSTN